MKILNEINGFSILYGDRRDLHHSIRRQRQMNIRDKLTTNIKSIAHVCSATLLLPLSVLGERHIHWRDCQQQSRSVRDLGQEELRCIYSRRLDDSLLRKGPNPWSLPSPVGRQQSRIYTNRAHGRVDSEIDHERYDQLSGQLAIPSSHKHGLIRNTCLDYTHLIRCHLGLKGGVGGSSQFARIVHSFLLKVGGLGRPFGCPPQ